jgi:hypothetical protein
MLKTNENVGKSGVLRAGDNFAQKRPQNNNLAAFRTFGDALKIWQKSLQKPPTLFSRFGENQLTMAGINPARNLAAQSRFSLLSKPEKQMVSAIVFCLITYFALCLIAFFICIFVLPLI